jgi:ABC-type Na+ efflux pump permease subunit
LPLPDTFFICAVCALAMPLGLNTVVVPAAYGMDTTDAAGMALVSHAASIITIPLILGLFVMMSAMQDPHGPLAFWFSMIPFTSPIVMMVRLPYGVPGWELGLSIGLLVVTFVAMVWLAGKIYRVGVFMYGKKPSFAELFKWMKYKY